MAAAGLTGADGVKQKDSVPVETAFDRPVIPLLKVHRKFAAKFAGMIKLRLGDIDAGDPAAVFAGQVGGQAAPAAADIQQMIAGLQFQFGGDQFQLADLGLGQVVTIGETGATVL